MSRWSWGPCGPSATLQDERMSGANETEDGDGGTGLPNTETDPNAEMRTIPLIRAIRLDHPEMLQRRGKIKGPVANRQGQSRRWPEACQRGNLIAAAKPNRTWACTGRPFPSPSSLSLASPMQRASLPCQPSPAQPSPDICCFFSLSTCTSSPLPINAPSTAQVTRLDSHVALEELQFVVAGLLLAE